MDFVGHVAWPIAILVIVGIVIRVFKEPIVRLIDRVKGYRGKYGEVDCSGVAEGIGAATAAKLPRDVDEGSFAWSDYVSLMSVAVMLACGIMTSFRNLSEFQRLSRGQVALVRNSIKFIATGKEFLEKYAENDMALTVLAGTMPNVEALTEHLKTYP